MKKYKLIEKYPGSPELGKELTPKMNSYNKDTDNFYWNGSWFNPNHYPKFWEEVSEKDYEILEICLQRSDKHQIVNMSDRSDEYIVALLKCDGNKINSVKRLSDGEIFTIGDDVKATDNVYVNLSLNKKSISSGKSGEWLSCFYKTKVKSFVIIENILCIIYEARKETHGQPIEFVQKIKEPLFTTEDGIDVFRTSNDVYYVDIDLKLPIGNSDPTTCNNSLKDSWKFFSTKEKAEEYIIMNKPCLSVNDLLEYKSVTNNIFAPIERFKELVQKKIK